MSLVKSISSRFRFRQVLGVVVGVSTLLVAACGSAEEPTAVPPKPAAPTAVPAATAAPQATAVPATPAPTHKMGGVVTTTYNGTPPDFDVVKQSTFSTSGPVGAVYSRLLRYKVATDLDFGSIEIEPDLAESWEISSDGLTYTFNLRKGAKWQDLAPVNGREFTSADVAFSAEILGASKHKALYTNIASIETPDDYTVVMKLKDRNVEFLNDMASHYAKIISKEVHDQDGEFGKTLVGTGAWIMSKASREVGFTAERNPTYFREGRPYLDGWKWLIIPDKSTWVAAMQAGRVDLGPYCCGLPLATADEFGKKNPDWTFKPGYRANLGGLIFNTQVAPWDNPKVREAVNLAIDRRRLAKLKHGVEESTGLWRLEGFIPSVIQGYGLPKDEIEALFGNPDIAKAKSILSAEGFDSIDATLSFFTGHMGTEAPIIQAMLKEIGINATLDPKDRSGWYEQVMTTYTHELSMGIFTTSFSPNFWTRNVYKTGTGRNYFAYSNAAWDKAADEQMTLLDEAARQKVIVDAQRNILAKDLPFLPYAYNAQALFSAPAVKDWNPHWQYGLGSLEITWLDR